MVKPTVISETPISMVSLKKELESIKKKEKELSFRSNKTHEYLSQLIQISAKDADDLKKDLEKLKIPRLKDIHVIKILDLMPTSVEDLKALLQSYTVTINNENLKKIVNVINKYK